MTKLISFSGIDGAGKSTQINLIKKYLLERGYECEVFRFASENFREYLDSLIIEGVQITNSDYHLATALDIFQQFEDLKKKINSNDWIIFDRYSWCRLAVAKMYGVDNVELLKKIYSIFPKVDLNFHMSIDPNIAFSRIVKRGEDDENLDELQDFSFSYQAFLPENTIIVDSSSEMNVINEQIISQLEERNFL